jgi:hypothetical protein
MNNDKLKLLIRSIIQECDCEHSVGGVSKEMEIDEERITNPESVDFVREKKNFIGSHCFGDRYENKNNPEDYIYVAYSYNYENPVFLYMNEKWYENHEPYYYDGEEVEQTDIHRENMRPTELTYNLGKDRMLKAITKKKHKFGIYDEPHTEVTPGIKNE